MFFFRTHKRIFCHREISLLTRQFTLNDLKVCRSGIRPLWVHTTPKDPNTPGWLVGATHTRIDKTVTVHLRKTSDIPAKPATDLQKRKTVAFKISRKAPVKT